MDEYIVQTIMYHISWKKIDATKTCTIRHIHIYACLQFFWHTLKKFIYDVDDMHELPVHIFLDFSMHTHVFVW
jgi:hypothetical protein